MHEASIVASVLRTANEATPDGAVLRRIHVRIGILTSVSPDAMRFYFDAMQTGQTELSVTIEPLRATCLDCGRRCTLSEIAWSCPHCPDGNLQFENGEELDLIAIEVEDAANHSDRRKDSGEERRNRCPEPAPV